MTLAIYNMYAPYALLHNWGHDLFLQSGKKYGAAPVCPNDRATLCRMPVSVRMKLCPGREEPRAAANSWAEIKALNTKAASQGSNSRAVGIYYTTDKRIPRRCFQLRNNSYTLGMNKLQSQVRGVHWLRVLLSLCLQLMKREREFSGFLPRQKKEGRGGGTRLETGPSLGQNKFKCESFYSTTKTL